MPLLPGLRRRVGLLVDQASRESARAEREITRVRVGLAERYLSGEGIEIGALHRPLHVPLGARVRYVDRMTTPDLRREYPELAGWKLVDVDIVDDGETLGTIEPESLDFVVANHFIEHTEDPLSAVASHLRVLRLGGVLFMAVPDKRHTFDIDREVTRTAHIVRDRREGPAVSRVQHYEEWARYIDRAPDPTARASELMDEGYSIHFHVWTSEAFAELLEYARSEDGLPFSVQELVPNGNEFVVVLRKTGPS